MILFSSEIFVVLLLWLRHLLVTLLTAIVFKDIEPTEVSTQPGYYKQVNFTGTWILWTGNCCRFCGHLILWKWKTYCQCKINNFAAVQFREFGPFCETRKIQFSTNFCFIVFWLYFDMDIITSRSIIMPFSIHNAIYGTHQFQAASTQIWHCGPLVVSPLEMRPMFRNIT